MKRYLLALFIALIIHFILLFLYLIFEDSLLNIPIAQKNPQEKKIKISLKEMPKEAKNSGIKQEDVKPSIVAPPMPKGSQLKKIIKKPPLKYKPKKVHKKPKLNPKPTKVKPKEKPKPKIEPLPAKKIYIPLVTAKKQEENTTKENLNPLYALLSQDKSMQEQETKTTQSNESNNINQNIKELYGDEFGKLSVGQQEYILDNQEIMRRITQEVLNRQARVANLENINVNKSNIIEFYLHPNGDMSDFKFLDKSGYFVLDDITKATIDFAYSKYPRPKEKTLIRYNVFYNLRRF